MSNIKLSRRETICCIFGVIFFCAFGAHAAVSSPDPDNAALLYYQAFLRRPELDDATFSHYDNVLRGGKPDEEVREYLDMVETRETLRIAEAATEILDCSWGIVRSEGNYNLTPTILSKLTQLMFLLEVDARTLAVDGDYRVALNRCLSIRRFSQHIADEGTIGYFGSLQIHGRAFLCIRHVLSSMSLDTDILTWLQGQLSTLQGPPPLPGRAIEITLDETLKFLRMRPELLAAWRESLSELIEDENARQEILNLTDEEFLERARESYNSFLASVYRVIGSDMQYRQKHKELQELTEELLDQADGGDPVAVIALFMMDYANGKHKEYDLYVRQKANFNAIRTAIEIYLMKAETGQLPEKLPPYRLPKDPFSGKNFEYDTAKDGDGFVLRCREEEIGKNKLWEYEFAIAQ
jgi:hypothetical protein